MKARVAAAVAALVIGVGALTGCGPSNSAQYQSICVNPITQLRVLDSQCLTNSAWWWYVPYGQLVPAYGIHPLYGVRTAPVKSRVVYGGAPAAGGKVTAKAVKPASPKVTGGKAPAKVNLNKGSAPKVKAPGYKAPAYKAPAYKAPVFKSRP